MDTPPLRCHGCPGHFFSDIKGSTALKESLASSVNEQAYHDIRHEHDGILTDAITRDGAGQVVKSTGDGFMAVFLSPAVAVERAMEIQERLRGHRYLSVRIGLDMGEVQVDWEGNVVKDVFGRHADWSARVEAMSDGGHTLVTKPVYTDAFSWITKSQIAWKEQGAYRIKPGEPPLEIFEPYNANLVQPLTEIHGEKMDLQLGAAPRGDVASVAETVRPLRVVSPWEAAAQECRQYAERGSGFMYWGRATLGEICYPEGFAVYLQPALANPRITKIRFVLNNDPVTRRNWQQVVTPLLQSWAASERRKFRLYQKEGGGEYVEDATPSRKSVQWLYHDLTGDYSSFKLFQDDPTGEIHTEPAAQLILSSMVRNVRFAPMGGRKTCASRTQ
ncbi:MAG: adenylate/guanylate cyclase domain-containing protein [Chloroflexi bacterium]|nr:adenylate/guanylate cyclase domain-containing protein [Chloroflexota bacterium]